MQPYADEIDLRVYIDLLWRWRVFIIAVVLFAALAAGVLSYFVLRPVYEASAQIMTPKDPFPSEIIMTPQFLQGIIDKLDLGDKYNPFTLQSEVTIEASKTSSSLTNIRVRSNEPNTATRIANTIAQDFLQFVKDKNLESVATSVSYLESQRSTLSGQLSKQRSERDAIRQSGRLEALQDEVTRLSQRISGFRSQVSEGQIREKELEKGIAEIEAVMAATPRTVSGPLDWSGHVTEVPNQTYQTLEENRALKRVELSELRVRVAEISETLPSLESQHSEAFSRLVALQRQLQDLDSAIAELTSESATLEAKINQLAVSLPTTSLVSQAVAPIEPIAPRKLLNVAVASVLAGFGAVFVVFAIEYWRSPRRSTTTAA